MPLTEWGRKQVLDWMAGGATGTQPPGRWITFATGSPNAAGASDGPFTRRHTVTFAGANSPQMSKTNLNALSTCTATAIATVLGWNIYDRSVGGTRVAYGTVTASIGCASADNVLIAAGALKITLS